MRTNISVKWFLIGITFLVSMESYAQASEDFHKRLYYLCKVWGYVKYHHTEVAKGLVNWDDELFIAITNVSIATSDAEFNNAIKKMIDKAGVMGSSDASLPQIIDSLNYNRDFGWFHNPLFSNDVSALLDTISQRFRPQNNVYVPPSSTTNPVFDKDTLYYQSDNSPLGYEKKLLGLFRYWNIINYFYPYKNIIDQPWDSVLYEFIPKIIYTSDLFTYQRTIKELITRIDDSHSSFFCNNNQYYEWIGYSYPPFDVRYIENEMVVTKVLQNQTSVKVGDIIKAIDGKDIIQYRNYYRPYAEGSNEASINRNINYYILSGSIGPSNVVVYDGISTRTIPFDRNQTNYTELNLKQNTSCKVETTNAGKKAAIIDMGVLQTNEIDTMFTTIRSTDAIIFDLRNYPKGTLWFLVHYLFPSSTFHIANFTVPDRTYPGRLYWKESIIGSGTTNPYQGKVIILFDERTISQAEYTCMGLEQYPQSIKIGSTTSGADGNVSFIYLPGGIRVAASFLGVFYPDYTPTQRVGIKPDIFLSPTIKGIREGRDELMECAFKQIDLGFTNIDNLIEDHNVSIFPIPTKNILFYNVKEDGLSHLISIEILDLLGNKVEMVSSKGESGQIDVSHLRNGVYFVKFISNKKVFTRKIIVKN